MKHILFSSLAWIILLQQASFIMKATFPNIEDGENVKNEKKKKRNVINN